MYNDCSPLIVILTRIYRKEKKCLVCADVTYNVICYIHNLVNALKRIGTEVFFRKKS